MRKKMMGGGMMQKPMYKDGGKIKKPKVKKIIAGGMGKAKDYPGIKKIMEMNKEGRKKFKMGGSVEDKIRKIGLEVKANPLPKKTKNLLGKLKKAYSKRPGKKMGGSFKAVPADNKGLKKLPTEVRNKMGFMKKGGVVSDTKKKQFKANQAGQKATNKKAMKVAKGVLNVVVPAVGAAEVGKKIARKFKGDK
jgi:hypothetical protein